MMDLPHVAAGVFYEQGKLNEAIQTYQEAISREPNFPEAYNNLGNALREAGRADEAIACYTMCIQLQFARPQNAQMARAMQVSPSSLLLSFLFSMYPFFVLSTTQIVLKLQFSWKDSGTCDASHVRPEQAYSQHHRHCIVTVKCV